MALFSPNFFIFVKFKIREILKIEVSLGDVFNNSKVCQKFKVHRLYDIIKNVNIEALSYMYNLVLTFV